MLPIRDHEPSHIVPYVTIGLITLNILVFFQEMLSPNIEAFIAQWALVPAAVELGNPFTWLPFITSQFLHGGVAHILFNMWYLWIFGDNVEAHFGHGRFLLFYLTAGVAGGLAQFAFATHSPIPMLGASGAIAGVLGAYWALFPRHRVDTLLPYGFSRATLPASTVLLFWFVTQLFSGVGSIATGAAAVGGVAWFAHIGGFVFGMAIAWTFRGTLRHPHPPHAHAVEDIDMWK